MFQKQNGCRCVSDNGRAAFRRCFLHMHPDPWHQRLLLPCRLSEAIKLFLEQATARSIADIIFGIEEQDAPSVIQHQCKEPSIK